MFGKREIAGYSKLKENNKLLSLHELVI